MFTSHDAEFAEPRCRSPAPRKPNTVFPAEPAAEQQDAVLWRETEAGGYSPRMMADLIRRAREVIQAHAVMLRNSSALLVSTGTTAAIGFVFWWVAARHFSQQAVGVASAAISMMSLIALVGECGLGTLLVGESLRTSEKSAGLIPAAILTAVLSSSVLCLCYLALAHIYPSAFAFGGSLDPELSGSVLFAGCAITCLTMVLDSAFVGLLRSLLQTWRTFVASTLKLVFLAAAAYLGFVASANTIVIALIGGQALSVLMI
jgi:O-antigen/teichoic acid export membrane protein